jgi:hypothetical protein
LADLFRICDGGLITTSIGMMLGAPIVTPCMGVRIFYDMGIEVREYDVDDGGVGFFLLALLGDGYDLFILLRSSLVISLPGGTVAAAWPLRDPPALGELVADEFGVVFPERTLLLPRLGLSPLTLLRAELSLEPESVLGAGRVRGDGGTMRDLDGPAAEAELILLAPIPPLGVVCGDAVAPPLGVV